MFELFQTSGLHTGRGKFNYHLFKGHNCWPLRKTTTVHAASFSAASSTAATPEELPAGIC
eukprot:6011381-Amphidinium_carterae.3